MKASSQNTIPSYRSQCGLISTSRRFRRPKNIELACVQAQRVLQIHKNREIRRPLAHRRNSAIPQVLPAVLATQTKEQQPVVQPVARPSELPSARTHLPLTLPTSLPRPKTRPIDLTHLADAQPDLAKVPAEFVRSHLPAFGTRMFATLARVRKTNAPKGAMSTLPKELQIYVQGPPSVLPTHMFAVHGPNKPTPSAPGPAAPNKVMLIPAHELVFAANCAYLPALPKLSGGPSSCAPDAQLASPPSSDGIVVTVPLVPLCLPAPEVFPQLQHYLYTKQCQSLLAWLVPASLDRTNALELTRQATVIHSFWKNACALGVVDAQLYDTIDKAWQTILEALMYAKL